MLHHNNKKIETLEAFLMLGPVLVYIEEGMEGNKHVISCAIYIKEEDRRRLFALCEDDLRVYSVVPVDEDPCIIDTRLN